ncbi:aldo/keto reductase [Endozoicomonas sp. (ex Bugula neritina AB1)]|nr:aldo/keto reductase [Endozoicomonas sp. (ex Bugula neritina AB1)]
MEYRTLGKSDIKVSSLCLGTMTWGEQNSQKEAFQQLDCATEYGINFIDTAELYPVPPQADTYTKTETILGRWLKQRGSHDNLIIASKVAGPGPEHIDGGRLLNRSHIERAVEGSLSRLGVEAIDLYQLHWPDRNTNFFGKLGYDHQEGFDGTPIKETLEVLDDLVKAGKIKHYGLSNETPWGTMRHLTLSEAMNTPRAASIQNPYNLLNRTFEVGLAEIAHREQLGLLAYSPMAFGALSGKYLNGQKPEKGRLTLYKRFSRYGNPQAISATEQYVKIAHNAGLNPAQMALAFVTSRPFVTSNIIGATTMEQLKSNLNSSALTLSDDILAAINKVHTHQPNPSP